MPRKEEMPQEPPSASSVDISISAPAFDVMQDTLTRFLDTASVTRVYGEPQQYGDTVLIPAAEVLVGLGFGAGYGFGSSKEEQATKDKREDDWGGGGGGGGGGRTLSRPVAVIVASPQGVHVEPVVDTTKLALAAITAAGFMLATLFGIFSPKRLARRMAGE